jgi:molybdopterin synthase catalytic subunit
MADILVRTGPDPIDAADALQFVIRPQAGGTALFLGTVRSPNDGMQIDHLDYELWDDKAEAALADIAREALDRFGASRVFVAHRSGRVGVGEPSVVVAVSAPHRGEAFDACRFVIDTLKATAPIWKKEVTQDGEHWVGMPQ